MRLFACVLLSLLSTAVWAAEDHKPKKKDERGKRNLDLNLSHLYPGPPNSYRLERRISTGPQHPLYHSQFFPGPRPYTSYRKGRPYSLPPPPYAVQMEPLVHYSQRDPLYDSTNTLSLNTDGHNEITKTEDLITDNNHINENVYGPHQPHIIERPVYIKEPEPIIEIIIKESNITLPAPPAPPPPKKKKEEVQVFYVKYKKDPSGKATNGIIYDKPVPALTPKVPDEEEEEPEDHSYQHEQVTLPPPPSTTLRTIIKPDSEVYHSNSGVKVTFGKEGFDYHKRSSKPDDFNRPTFHSSPQLPQARQLSSFSTTYYKRAPITGPGPSFSSSGPSGPPPNFRPETHFPPSGPPSHSFRQENRLPPSGPPSGPPPSFRPENRQPQPYRPFNIPPPSSSFKSPIPRPVPPPFPPSPQKYPFQSPPYVKPNSGPPGQFPPTQYQQTISHPPPPQFQNRKPVPYKPFDVVKPQQSGQISFPPSIPAHSQRVPFQHNNNIPFRPETHFPIHQQPPLTGSVNNFNKPQFVQPPTQQFKSEDLLQHEVAPHHLRQQQQLEQQQREKEIREHQERQRQQQIHQQLIQQQQDALKQQQIHQQQNQYQQQLLPNFNSQQQFNQNEHLANIQHVQNVLPPGGELIHSLSKYEQHISTIEPSPSKQPQALPLESTKNQFLVPEQKGQQSQDSSSSQNLPAEHRQNPFLTQKEYEQKIQQQFNNVVLQQNPQLHQLQQFYQQQLQQQQQTSPKPVYYSTQRSTTTTTTTTTPKPTTTEEPEKPSTTTKDPKVLEAQLPDEVPEDLRAQLLSSGILNHADISILDYDKVGDIPISALPPDQLANFYGAGGAQQLAAASASGSEPIPSVVDINGKAVDQEPSASDLDEVKDKVQMKVVHYDPDTDKGQQVQEAYVQQGATQVNPVVLNDNTYNRYLPLKINGTQFPIPDVPELKGKQISSVVVLAPLSYDFSSNRKTRQTEQEVDDIELIQGDELKELLRNPTVDNYKKFLESENSTRSDRQSVILLVTNSPKNESAKEIFMYDVGTRSVSKLSGELSSAFVDAAEENSKKEAEDDSDENETSASNIIETRIPYTGSEYEQNFHTSDALLEESASDFIESKVPIIDPMDNDDLETQASEQLNSFVDISDGSIERDDLTASASDLNSIYNNLPNAEDRKTGQL